MVKIKDHDIDEDMYIQQLSSVSREEIDLVGGKAAVLGELLQQGFPIPQGFVITTKAYKHFYKRFLSRSLQKEIISAFENLQTNKVAVRSSSNYEDSVQASWAGQFTSYLHIKKKDLFKAIKKCWTSVETDQVAFYAQHHGSSNRSLLMAVIVQNMIESEISGVLFTVNPLKNDTNELVIEACRGVSDVLVQGEIIPDTYIVDKKNFIVTSKKNYNQQTNLSDKKIKELAMLSLEIEKYFRSPQDIEWALEKDRFIILQSRPITTV